MDEPATGRQTGARRRGGPERQAGRDRYAPPQTRSRSRRQVSRRNTAGVVSICLAGAAFLLWGIAVAAAVDVISGGSFSRAHGLVLMATMLGVWGCTIAGFITGLVGLQRRPKTAAIIGASLNGLWLVILLISTVN